jgi:hypothetical protein
LKLNNMLCRLLMLVYLLCHTHAIPNIHSQSNPINPTYPTKTVVKEATTQASPKKKKALVAVFGVFSRSLRKTWPQINRMIVKPLEKDYDVEIYGFNNQVDNIDMLDGLPVQKSTASTIKTNHKLIYQEVKQSQLDEYIQKDNSWLTSSWAPRYSPFKSRSIYSKSTKNNAVRQFYLEQHVSNYISDSNEDYDVVVALIADVYPIVPLSMDNVILKDNVVNIVSFQRSNVKNRITNGYYLGNKQSVAKIMSTVTTIATSVKNKYMEKMYYEMMLYQTLVTNKLEWHFTDMLFCKQRSTHRCVVLDEVMTSKQFKKLGLNYRLQLYFKYFCIYFESFRTKLMDVRIHAAALFTIGLLVIMARSAAMLHRAHYLNMKRSTSKGVDSI